MHVSFLREKGTLLGKATLPLSVFPLVFSTFSAIFVVPAISRSVTYIYITFLTSVAVKFVMSSHV